MSRLETTKNDMKIETWTSSNNDEEIHHFVDGEHNTYLFGFNEKLLGTKLYNLVLGMVASRLKKIQDKHKSDEKHEDIHISLQERDSLESQERD